ncbi:MAG: FAD-dependent monooxygenase [Ignavibacteria bacterium]|nr:FAD-dependent monooxygenase [Ignavibacteria bacterium]
MKKQIEIVVPPENINDKDFLYKSASEKLKLDPSEITAVIPVRRSVDARSSNPVFRILCNIFINENPTEEEFIIEYKPVKGDKKVLIVGCGPAGMFAALRLIELGIKPVIIERGKDVQSRRKDLRAIQQFHTVNPDSNYCFGEGGAGTYSDGKLYTRSTKRGDVKKVLHILVQHGAQRDILIDAHPHIGSNKLPGVVKAIRETIIRCGGEIHFNSRVTDFILSERSRLKAGKEKKITGVVVNDEKEFIGDAVILATGHSARDIFYLLHKRGIKIEPKPFALGVRIEHPQSLINEIQYHTKEKQENLPAASYNLACEINGRGVYSFCMCPGGIIVPTATSAGEIVVNGMSLSRRDSPFANSGFVVSVDEKDWRKYDKEYPFSALKLQQEIETLSFELAGKSTSGGQSAPAQRVTDFVKGIQSSSLPKSSYIPGLTSAPLHESASGGLPSFITKNLKKALFIFNKKMKGYFTEEAQIVSPESRTSSPIKIPRDKETLMHIDIEGLFPCGEGAGYAGGIVSAAIDGENCADAVSRVIN